MNKKIDRQFTDLQNIKLAPAEKNQMKASLILHMEKYPVRNSVSSRLIWRESWKIFVDSWLISKHTKYMTASIIIALILALGGGSTVAAAENSVPGDILYPVKINVTENIRAVAAISDESKASWNTEVVTRRLQEAEQLVAKDKLDSQTADLLSEEVKTHSELTKIAAQKLSDNQESEKAAAVNAQLEAKIKAHADILINIGQQNIASEHLVNLLQNVSSELSSVSDARIKTETRVQEQDDDEVQVSANGRLTAAENKIAEVQKYLDNKKNKVSDKIWTDAAERLNSAKQNLEKAKELTAEKNLDSSKYSQIYSLSLKSFRLAVESQSMINSGQRLNRDFRDTRDDSSNFNSNSNTNDNKPTPQATSTEDKILEIKNWLQGKEDSSIKLDANIDLNRDSRQGRDHDEDD